MNILLDTHVALWAITDSPRLGAQSRAMIEDPDALIWVSAASLWEIAIKHALGRGDMPIAAQETLDYFQASGFSMLPVSARHAVAVESLPPHHHDPFDRILIAQAFTEPMTLITHDAQILRYGNIFVAA
ncbi:MAG: type II toxin-antitoxin system VapC family toxin [Betaproteobacteria bacterium]|nr:type II toxin-antitoxin system VapC family toxin [Betaproteobacteria bacterium]